MKKNTKLKIIPGAPRRSRNENHHLWNNNGTWFLHYTIAPTPILRPQRVRVSLGTKDLIEARVLRDRFFLDLAEIAARDATARKQIAA